MGAAHRFIVVCVLSTAIALCQQIEDGLRIRAVAKRTAAPADDTPSLHWVPEPFPTASSLLVSNPALAQRLAEILQAIAAGDPRCPTWVLENSNECTLAEKLRREANEFSFEVRDHIKLLDPPETEGERLDLTLRVQYENPKPRTVDSLAVNISTGNANKPSAIRATFKAGDAARRGQLPPPDARTLNVEIAVALSEEDRKRRDGSLFSVDELQTELFRVGVSVLNIVAARGLVPGGTAPSGQQLTSIDDAIKEVYSIERPNWPGRSRTRVEGNHYSVDVSDLRFVAGINVEVVRGTIPGKTGPVAFEAATKAGEQKLAALLRTASERGRVFLRSATEIREGTIPSRESVQKAQERLKDLPFTRPPVEVSSSNDGSMTFQPQYDWIDSLLDARLLLQAGLDPEQLFTGTGKVHGKNLVYLLFENLADRKLDEDWDLELTGGPEVQKASLNVSVSRERGTRRFFSYGSNVLLFFSRDRNQRLGNLPVFQTAEDKGLQLIDQERGVNPKVFLQYERPGRWKHRVRWEGGLDWRHVLIRPQSRLLPVRADGQLTAWDSSVEERVWRGGRVGELSVVLNGASRLGRRQFSGDYDFWRPHIAASAEALSGWRSRRELLFRHEWGATFASAGTPLFQLPRMGGGGNVRGIEQGEFVGRELRYQQSTVGIGLPVFWPALEKAEGQIAALAHSYLTAFYDRGRVGEASRFTSANGYGIAAEIRDLPAGKQRAHISVGWARSPQSVLHRRGVVTMRVIFGF